MSPSLWLNTPVARGRATSLHPKDVGRPRPTRAGSALCTERSHRDGDITIHPGTRQTPHPSRPAQSVGRNKQIAPPEGHRALGQQNGLEALQATGKPRPRQIALRGFRGSTRALACCGGRLARHFPMMEPHQMVQGQQPGVSGEGAADGRRGACGPPEAWLRFVAQAGKDLALLYLRSPHAPNNQALTQPPFTVGRNNSVTMAGNGCRAGQK